MRLLFAFIVLACQLPLTAQVEVSPRIIHFGDVTKETDRVVDIVLTNKGKTKEQILRATFSFEFDTKMSGKTILPDSSIVIRIKFNPRQKGSFVENGEIWLASQNKPILVPIKANVLYVNVNENLPCPDFSQRAAECCVDNMYIVEVKDAETMKVIESANVKITEDGFVQQNLFTNKNGLVSQEIKIGYYTISAEKPGYLRNGVSSYVNKRNNHFTILLRKDANYVEPIAEAEPETVEKKDSVQFSEALPENLFKPNNIVFLLDISGSMGTGDKLELMQASLNQLTEVLRPTDKVALISYAGDAHVLLASTSGDQKTVIKEIVAAIHPQGKTAGAKGFQKSFKMIQKNLIADGNNQLIVITDGAFQPSDQASIEKLVRKYTRKGFRTSVVAIESNDFAKQKLKLVSEAGNGSFLLIDSLSDANARLIEEIKKQSAR